MVPHGSTAGGGTRAGLFRTPISGGVQNATSAHGLPRPSLAVRNLMEQVRFLCFVELFTFCNYICKGLLEAASDMFCHYFADQQ